MYLCHRHCCPVSWAAGPGLGSAAASSAMSSTCDCSSEPGDSLMLDIQTTLLQPALLSTVAQLAGHCAGSSFATQAGLLPSDVGPAVSESQFCTAAKPIELPCSYRYTVLFAVARTVGWVSQWKEMAEEKLSKISRPRQVGRAGMVGLLSRAEVCKPVLSAVSESLPAAIPALCACQANPALLARHTAVHCWWPGTLSW